MVIELKLETCGDDDAPNAVALSSTLKVVRQAKDLRKTCTDVQMIMRGVVDELECVKRRLGWALCACLKVKQKVR